MLRKLLNTQGDGPYGSHRFEAGGSRVVCNPPPTDTDEDYILLVSNAQRTMNKMIEDGWDCSKGYAGELFTSLRKGTLNYVVTDSVEYFEKFMLATRVSKKLNLLNKEDRITVFQAIMYGNG